MQILSERIRPVGRLFGMAENRYGFSQKRRNYLFHAATRFFKSLYPFSKKSLNFSSRVYTLSFCK